MTPRNLVRRGPAARLAAVLVLAAGVAVLPSLAVSADTGASTVVAFVDGSGAVTSVKQMSVDGGTSSFSGKLPVKLSITQNSSGGKVTYTYHVQNTWSRQQTINYVDTLGKPHHTSRTLQLPLVAQLGVTLPASMKDVTATGAESTTDASGAKRLLWDMVLFTPLGSPSTDVSFTASGSGAPVAELRATPIDPTNTPGLSASGTDATASYQQDDFWNGYANGGNGGLTQLRDGVAKMVAGLQQLYPGAQQLHDGIAQAQGGAVQLDDGTRKAYLGSKKLSAGLGQIDIGAGALSTGLGQIHTGQGALTDGIKKLHDGQSSLTTGLGQISGGLGQLADPTTGLPTAVTGLQQINTGIGALLAGVGDDTTANTLINGVDQIVDGVKSIQDGFTATGGVNDGIACSIDIITVVADGAGAKAGTTDPCFYDATNDPTATVPNLPGLSGTDPVAQAYLDGVVANALTPVQTALTTQIEPGLTALESGATLVRAGLSHPVGAGGATDQGGVKEGLLAIQQGLTQLLDPTTGLPAAVAGIDQLNTGAAQALSGSQQLTDGSGQALTGSQQLYDGSGQAYTGSKKLASGAGAAYDGSKSLTSGLKQLSDGQHQVATGLPAAVTGSGQIADGIGQVLDGAKQVGDGLAQVQDGAVAPLTKQLQQASVNAHQQLAVIDAAAALADQAPGGAHASYVLSQNTQGFRLAAATSSTGSDHTARNVGVGLGGLALLLVGIFGGFAAGRRARVSV